MWLCQTKAVSHENSDLAGTIEGVNMTFPPVPKQRLPSIASDLYKHSSFPAPPLVQPFTPPSRAQHPSSDITMHGQRVIRECRGCCCYLRSNCKGPQGAICEMSQIPKTTKKKFGAVYPDKIGCCTLTDNIDIQLYII